MANEKKVVSVTFKQKQVTELVSKYKEMETILKNWVSKPPLAVEAITAAVTNGVDGAVFSIVFDTIVLRISSVLPLPPPFKVNPESLRLNAYSLGALTGVDAGVRCVMKKIRGKDDVETRMVAGFGGGIACAMVHCEQPAIVIAFGVLFALAEGAMFKAKEKRKAPEEWFGRR